MRTNIVELAANIDNEILELGYRKAHLVSLLDAVQRVLQRKGRNDETLAQRNEEMTLQTRLSQVQRNLDKLNAVHGIYNWNRAYIVPGGHVHKGTTCHTLGYDTQIVPVPEVSGMTDDEVVAKAGERACTHCYPTAPSEYFQRKSELMTRDEAEAAAQKAEKEAAKIAKAAKKVIVTDYPERVYKQGASQGIIKKTEVYGSLRSAQNEVLNRLYWALYSSEHIELVNEYRDQAQAIVKAMAAHPLEERTPEQIMTECETKAQKKYDSGK